LPLRFWKGIPLTRKPWPILFSTQPAQALGSGRFINPAAYERVGGGAPGDKSLGGLAGQAPVSVAEIGGLACGVDVSTYANLRVPRQAHTFFGELPEQRTASLVNSGNVAHIKPEWLPSRDCVFTAGLHRVDPITRQFPVHRDQCACRFVRNHHPYHSDYLIDL